MLTSTFYYIIGKIFPLFTYCGISTYTWNKNTNLFLKQTGSKYLTYYNGTTLVMWNLFYICQIIRFCLKQDLNTTLFLITFLLAIIFSSMGFLLSVISADNFFLLINWILIFLRRIQSKCLLHNTSNFSQS